jgi:YfiH family protein
MRARFLLTDRRDGVSAPPYDGRNLASHVGDDPHSVAANRQRLAETLGLAPGQLAFMEQVHGRTVAVVDDAEATPEADALLTTRPGLGLVVLVADCVPVLLAAKDAAGRPRAVAVAHAGRRGLQLGVVPEALAALTEHGALPERTVARIGPAVCARCYEVPEEMAQEVGAAVPAARARTPAGGPALDLRAGVLAQLRAAGVTDIEVDPRCTRETSQLYSYRRDGLTGRFAGIAWLHSD